MATTIASLHLLTVLAVALLTKSRLLTWLAALGVLYAAFTVGQPSYALMDGISTLIGLGMGIALIGKAPVTKKAEPRVRDSVREPAQPQSINPNTDQPTAHSTVSTQVTRGPAKEFELNPRSKRNTGRWIALGLIVFATAWGYYS